MENAKNIATTDEKEFLQSEFENVYKRVFATYEQFEKEMCGYVRKCGDCNTLYWLSNSKRCECEYLKHLAFKEHHKNQDHESSN